MGNNPSAPDGAQTRSVRGRDAGGRRSSERRVRIAAPDSAKEKPREGVVMAVGLGKLLDNGERQSLSVKKKDRVLFSSYAGSEIKIDGEEMLILAEDEILAVID